MVTVKINGKEITVEEGTLILDAARSAGYEIPTFCYQADLVGIGSCRMCLVEIEGQKKMQPSCVTPVMHGMSILTETPTVMSARSSMLEFLLANHALDCPVCDKAGECELQDAVYKYGPHKGRHSEKKFKFHEKDYILSPVIIKNSNRCVQCMKCVRVCREVVGANVLGGVGRGDHQEETSFLRTFLDCDQDGNCIEVCPVGCFMRLPYRYKSRPWDLKGADTVCPYCGTGCRMVIESRDGIVIRSKAQLGVGINSETLCARGRFGFDFMNSAERITSPMVRRHGNLEPASWEEALSVVKESLLASRGDRVGGVASARLTNEELYLFGRLMREYLGSPNLDSSVRFAPAAAEAFIAGTGMNGGGVSIFDGMEADTLLVIGSHLSDENPVSDYIVRRISAGRAMNVIIASPRAMKLDSSASMVLRHAPASEGAVLDSIVLGLLEANTEKLSGLEGMKAAKDRKWSALSQAAGVTEADLKDAAKRVNASAKVSIIAGTDFLRFPEGSHSLGLLKDALKALGKTLTIVPALDRCNQRGAWEMGVHPSLGPGYAKAKAGLGTRGMVSAARSGQLDAMYVVGVDIVRSYPDGEAAREALAKLKFLVVQDIFMTETARMAHVVLPGASFGEKEGTFTNQEGRVQAISKLQNPPGKCRSDREIIGSILKLIDPSVTHSADGVFREIRKTVPMYREVSLEFNNKRNTDNRLDNKASLVKGSGTTVSLPKVTPGAAEPATSEYPFVLVTGNHLFHSGTHSMKSPTLQGLLKAAAVEISEEDAAALGLKSGERVRVSGKGFGAVLTLRTRKGTRKGVAFIAENFEDVPVARFFREGVSIPRVSIKKP